MTLDTPTRTQNPVPDAPRGAGECLVWRVHLAAEQPAKAALAAALIAAVTAWAYFLFGSLGTALAAAAVLLGAVGEFLFPVTYRLGPAGAEARGPFYWRRISWRDVRRVRMGPGVLKLSPLVVEGPGDAFRGVILRCPENHDAVLSLVSGYRDAAPAG